MHSSLVMRVIGFNVNPAGIQGLDLLIGVHLTP